MNTSRKARGFAAVEIIVVVAVLGAIFLMTLKGTAAVEMMRAIATVYQIRNLQNTVQNYVAQFRQLPGDDAEASKRLGRPPALTIVEGVAIVLAGDGVIQGPLSDPLNPEGEQMMAWRDLRLSGIYDGDPALIGQAAMPDNAFGGVYGFAEDNFGLEQVICATHLPGRAAAYADEKLDDGNIATGRVRGTAKWDPNQAKNRFDTPDTTPYDPNKTYIICMPYQP